VMEGFSILAHRAPGLRRMVTRLIAIRCRR